MKYIIILYKYIIIIYNYHYNEVHIYNDIRRSVTLCPDILFYPISQSFSATRPSSPHKHKSSTCLVFGAMQIRLHPRLSCESHNQLLLRNTKAWISHALVWSPMSYGLLPVHTSLTLYTTLYSC